MRSPRAALLVTFAGGAGALLGLAWDVSNHTAYPALFAHETPIDPLSPSHDLIAVGIFVAALGGAWSLWLIVDRRLGLVALLPIITCVGWLGFTAFDPPAQPLATDDQRAAADQLWSSTYAATRKYLSLAVARQDGYVAYNPFSDLLVHYVNPEYMRDGRILDPNHVESLVYENTLRGPVLVAAMYSLEDPNAAPPDVAGSLTPWHRHDDLCFTQGGEPVGAAPFCPPGSASYFTPWMLHVWFIPNRYGRFAADPDPWSVMVTEIVG
jgi:hypothetical protein